jgi:hypothetical protein
LEEAIASIWRDALGVAAVDRTASFFDLGGNSLLLVKVHKRLCDQHQSRLSLADLFHFPTVASLAAHLSSADLPVTTGAGSSRAQSRRLATARRRDSIPINSGER